MSELKDITYFCKFDQSQQPAMFFQASGDEPRPLVVALHTWSMNYTQGPEAYYAECQKRNWHLIYPHFRGPNWTPEACGSDLVVSDIEDAVSYMKSTVKVDPRRVYLIGGSGGGHCTLLLAGRRPDLWTAVSAWCPISDVAAWYAQCINRPCKQYSEHIVKACGGIPEAGTAAAREARTRSPLTWLANARELPVDINTGIHDGHTGSVPISQAFNAFNILADAPDRLTDSDIAYAVKNEQVPASWDQPEADPCYGKNFLHFRRQSHNVRMSLFEGGHDILPATSFNWLERQVAGQTPDWGVGRATAETSQAVELTK